MLKDIIMPKIGLDMEEGKVETWFKKVGDAIAEGETIMAIETDKTVTEVEASFGGILAEIMVEEGDTVPIGTPVARVETAG